MCTPDVSVCRTALCTPMRMASVPFTVPDGAGLLAKTQVTTPAVPGVDPKQASTGGALGLVILVVESKGSPKGELHVNTVLEHVDVRCCSIFAMVSASESTTVKAKLVSQALAVRICFYARPLVVTADATATLMQERQHSAAGALSVAQA